MISEPTQDVSCHNETPTHEKKKLWTSPQTLTQTRGRESHLSFVTRSVFRLIVGWSTKHNCIQMKATREGLQTRRLCGWHFREEVSLVAQMVKRLPTMQETQVQSLGQEDLPEKEMATHSNILAWEIPWTEEPGGLQSMGDRKSVV